MIGCDVDDIEGDLVDGSPRAAAYRLSLLCVGDSDDVDLDVR